MLLPRILSAGSWVLGGLVIGRLTGILRESLVAARFGAGPEADIAVFPLPGALLLDPYSAAEQ